jgi:hypothetical protein
LRHRDNFTSDMTSLASAGIEEGGSDTAADAASAAIATGTCNRGLRNQFSVACMTTLSRVAPMAHVV